MNAVGASADAAAGGAAGGVRTAAFVDGNADAARARTAFAAVAILTVAAALLQKFALPVPAGEVGLNVAVTWGALVVLALWGGLALDATRLTLFAAFCGAALIGIALSGRPVQPLAFGVIAAVYAPLCFRVPVGRALALRCLDVFQNVMIAVTAIVLIQQLLQYTVGNRYWPSLNGLPSVFLYDGFAYFRPYSYGSPLLRPNGVFFLEVSVVSHYLASALVLELTLFRRASRLAAFVAGLLACTAGTGPAMLVLASPLLLRHVERRHAVAAAVVGAPLLAAAAWAGLLDAFLSRAGEFADPKSSGYLRIVAPVLDLGRTLGDPWNLVTGTGPGTSSSAKDVLQWPVSKLAYEYGLLTAILFHLFLFAATLFRPPSRTLAVAVLIPHLLFGGGFVSHANVMLILLLCSLLDVRDDGPATTEPLRQARDDKPAPRTVQKPSW